MRLLKKRTIYIIAMALGIVGAPAVGAPTMSWAAATKMSENDTCLACHGSEDGAAKELLHIIPEVFRSSVHGDMRCTDCHEDADMPESREGKTAHHQKRLKPVECTVCHYKGNPEGAPNFTPMQQYRASVHGRASIEKGDTDVATCSDCHGKHNIKAASDPESTIYRTNIPRTCAVCHENMQMILKHNIHVEQPYKEYQQSVHGKSLIKDGLATMAAVCTDCHGVHDIQANGEADLKPHLPGTCGKCHLNEYLDYSRSLHGKAFKAQIKDAPVCADCHGEHDIAAPWNPDSSVSVFNITQTCAKCHDDVAKMSKYNILTDKVSTYRHSDHGIGSDLGIVSVATCASCHGYHDILPASDPESSINRLNIRKTCGQPNCHPDATPELLETKVHVDKESPDIEALRRIRSVAKWSIMALLGLGLVSGVVLFASRVTHRAETERNSPKKGID